MCTVPSLPSRRHPLKHVNDLQLLANSLSLGATVATTTASLSASRDGYAAAKAGDFKTGAELASEGQSWNTATGAFIVESGDPEPVVTCEALQHFSGYDEPFDSPVWLTYHTTMDVLECRGN